MTDHPITPPPDKFKQWEDDILNERENVDVVLDCVWKDGFRAGADQELEACCEWLQNAPFGLALNKGANSLRAARRPKPPSQADLALEALDAEDDAWPIRSLEKGLRFATIRAALKRLKELEQANSQPS